MALSKEDIEQLKRDHGDRLMAVSNPIDMVFKAPPREVWADFQDGIAKDKGTRESVYRRLAVACCVYPAQDDALRIFDVYPALATKVGDALGTLVGLGGDFDVKKL